MRRHFLIGAAVLAGGVFLEGQGVLVRDGIIEAVLPAHAAPAADVVQLPPDSLLAPGFLDIQVNGGGGMLFNDAPTRATAMAIAAAHRRLGTTGILPTLITDTVGAMRQAAATLLGLDDPASPILGLHFEGPFLSPDRPGVHDRRLVRAPAEAELALLENLARTTRGRVLLTLAPEVCSDDDLHRLAAVGIVLSAGHSAASFERTLAAVQAGVAGFTHLFNAMPPLSARAPGIAAAALLDPGTWCGVIADGIHVHPGLLRLLLATKPADRVMLVSDAMPPTGTDMDGFVLQGRHIQRRDGRLTTGDGVLAGADICLADAVRSVVDRLGVAPERALAMASSVPAAFLRLDHLTGHIAPSRRADLVLLTRDLAVLGTWQAGEWSGDAGVLMASAA